jgi:hypothetical protein
MPTKDHKQQTVVCAVAIADHAPNGSCEQTAILIENEACFLSDIV